MPSLQDIKRRTKSVKSIQQITNAMDMVATSRMRHAKEAAQANRPYAEKVSEVVKEIAVTVGGEFSHPLLETPEEGHRLVLVMAADKGLAGAYSSNACKEALQSIEDKATTEVVTVGRKPRDFFKHRNYNVAETFTGFSEKPHFEHAQKIARHIIERFESGEISDVQMVYTRFVSAISCVPETVQLLPFVAPEGEAGEAKGPGTEYIYEPSAEAVLGHMLPQYLYTTVYAALLQAAASELSSRMNAMSNATDNAAELISKLELHYNKVRQAGITTELNEIVSGAEALK
jgi:F-type H+-transporting ATPase subunit gamma